MNSANSTSRPMLLSFHILLILALLLALIGACIPRSVARATSIDPAIQGTSNSLLQYQSGGHVLGFDAHKIYMAAADHALSLEFLGSSGAQPRSSDGAAQTARTKGAAPLTTVTYPGLWQGIDAQFQAADGKIAKSTYLLAPGADSRQIRLGYNVPVQIEMDGTLKFQLATQRGSLSESAPLAWQMIGGQRTAVDVRFTQLGAQEVGFSLGAYDANLPLTVDPEYVWHTFWGGDSTTDFANGMALDAAGNIYITGTTYRSFTGPNNNPPKNPFSGGGDIYVLKLDASGGYVWHTFFGSSAEDDGEGITLDSTGAINVAGYSYATWNTVLHAPLHAFGTAGPEAVVIQLDANGYEQWHTFYGEGDGIQDGTFTNRIAMDAADNMYIVGSSKVSWNGDGNTPARNLYTGGYDVFVLKLSPNGSYGWHTFYGSGNTDYGQGIVIYGADIYVVGSSYATWQGPANQNPVSAYSGGEDILVLNLNTITGAYQRHGFYGGSGDDSGYAITFDNYRLIITGSSSKAWGSPLHAYTAGDDIVVLNLDTLGSYKWHTFYGGSANDQGVAASVDSAHNIYISGTSSAAWTPGASFPAKHAYSGGSDLVALKLDSSGALQWYTFYGSSSYDFAYDSAVDGNGNLIIAGQSNASWLGDNNAAPKHAHGGASDIVVVKLNNAGTYQWHTFWSAEINDNGASIAVDGSGNVYFAGNAGGPWVGPTGQKPIHPFAGVDQTDIVVTKLNSSGAYQWHTFYGSSQTDQADAIAVDSAGNVYVTGFSDADWQGDGNATPKHPFTAGSVIFILKLNKDGVYQWHTFYGASISQGTGLVINSSYLYITGNSSDTWLGDNVQSPIHPFNVSGINLFVLKIRLDGTYQWHTFYPNGYPDKITADSAGNVYATGAAFGTWQGPAPANAAPIHAFSGNRDLFILKLDPSGAYQWHTFYGGNGGNIDEGYDIAVDPQGKIFVTGTSNVNWLGDGGAAPIHASAGLGGILLLCLNTSGVYQWHAFYGSNHYDSGRGISLDGKGGLFILGMSSAAWNGPAGQLPDRAYSGQDDMVVLGLDTAGTYRFHTFLGGPGEEWATGIATDGRGSVYGIGYSRGSWLGNNNTAPLHRYQDGYDIAVFKLGLGHNIFLPAIVR